MKLIMYKRVPPIQRLFAVLFLIFLQHLHAEDKLIRKKGDNGLYGYADPKTGQFVIRPQFDILSRSFSEGIAAVTQDGKYGFIDKTGTFVLPLQSDWNLPGDFHEGLAHIYKRGQGGYIDKTGKIIILSDYSVVTDFSEGLAAVCSRGAESKWGYINKKGEVSIPFTFDIAHAFTNGQAFVIIDDQHAIIGKDGKYLKRPQFPPEAEYTYRMTIIPAPSKGEKRKSEYVIRIRYKGKNRDFETVEETKNYLRTIPKGSLLVIVLDCFLSSEKPIIGSQKEMQSFKEFLSLQEIKLKIYPGV